MQPQQASPPTQKSIGLQSKQDTSEKATPPYSKTVRLDATAVEFHPPTTPQQTTSYSSNLSEAQINPQFQQQSDV